MSIDVPEIAPASPDIRTLDTIARRVLWTSTAIIHHANRVRPNPSGLIRSASRRSCQAAGSVVTTVSTTGDRSTSSRIDRRSSPTSTGTCGSRPPATTDGRYSITSSGSVDPGGVPSSAISGPE